MARLRGTGLGAGMALGTAATVRARRGVAMTPSPPERIAQLIAAHRLSETPEVILVAEEYEAALAAAEMISWARVVGIAAEFATHDPFVPSFPAVVNVAGLMTAVEEDTLLLVDAVHGIVLADPGGMAIAQYQAEHDHIAPKRRLYIEEVHLPAHTTDGRTVQIVAWVETAADLAQAMEAGADALHLAFGCPLLPDSEDDAMVRTDLLQLIERAAGKPLFLSEEYALPPLALLEASARAEITLAEPPRADLSGLGLLERAEELQAQAELLDSEATYALPYLAADATDTYAAYSPDQEMLWVEALAARGATRLLFTCPCEAVMEFLPGLEAAVTAATASMLPTIVRLTASPFDATIRPEALCLLVGMGVADIVVLAEQVGATKAVVRELNFSECRDVLFARLREAEGDA